MEEKPLRPVKGRFRVRDNVRRMPHEEGFRYALDHALDNVTRRGGWTRGVHKDVKVEFSATIEVENPGHIIEYAVTLTPSG